MVLLEEFEKDPALRVHVVMLRARIRGDFTFERKGVVYHVLKAPGWSRLRLRLGYGRYGICLRHSRS